MKKILAVLIVVVSSTSAFAQDVKYSYDQKVAFQRTYQYGKEGFEIKCLALPDLPLEEGDLKYQQVFDIEGSQKDLHSAAVRFIAETYKSSKAVIDLNDSEAGILVAQGYLNDAVELYWSKKSTNLIPHQLYHKLSIETKDNKVRVSVTEIRRVIPEFSIDQKLSPLIQEYLSIDGENSEEPDFRRKANQGNILVSVHKSIRALMGNVPTFIKSNLEQNW